MTIILTFLLNLILIRCWLDIEFDCSVWQKKFGIIINNKPLLYFLVKVLQQETNAKETRWKQDFELLKKDKEQLLEKQKSFETQKGKLENQLKVLNCSLYYFVWFARFLVILNNCLFPIHFLKVIYSLNFRC